MARTNGTPTLAHRSPLPGEAPATPVPGNVGFGLATPSAVDQLAEKVRSATLAGRVTFLPYLDPYTEETWAMRRMYPIMCRNPVVKQSLQHKVHAVAALDLQVIPADETDRDHEVADFVRYNYAEAIEGGFVQLAEEILFPALIYKSSIAEKVWDPELWQRGKFKGKRFYRAFKAKEYAEPLYDEFRNLVSIRAIGFGQAALFPPEDFVMLKNWPLFGGPGMSDLRAAYKYLWELDTLEKLHCIHMDRYVDPVMVANYDDTFDIANKPALEKDLMAMRARSWAVLPASVKVEALTLALTGSQAAFMEICKDRREQITLSITGAYLQMLTATSGGDIRGNSRVQQSTAELLVWELAARLAGVLNSQATPQLVDMNYAGSDYPTLVLGGISYQELLQAIEIDQIAQGMGAKLSNRGFARKYNLQLAADDDDIMQKPVAPVAPGTDKPPPNAPGFGGNDDAGDGGSGSGTRPVFQAPPARMTGRRFAAHDVFDEERDTSGKWTSGGGTRTKAPQPSAKAARAIAAHFMVDKEIQRYAEQHNEPAFAAAAGGVSFDDSEPLDIAIPSAQAPQHGVELKTMVENSNNKITMKRTAMENKAAWERKHKVDIHTVVLDDQKVFNANGAGKHDDSKRQMYYRRGYGSFRVGTMHPVKDHAELKKLMAMKDKDLPAAARRPAGQKRGRLA